MLLIKYFQGELEDKILDKDDEIHKWWTDGKEKGETIRRKDQELAEKEGEIALLKAELEELRVCILPLDRVLIVTSRRWI